MLGENLPQEKSKMIKVVIKKIVSQSYQAQKLE